MTTLQEVESEIKTIGAKIAELKASGGADPAVIKQHVVSSKRNKRTLLPMCSRIGIVPVWLLLRTVFSFSPSDPSPGGHSSAEY